MQQLIAVTAVAATVNERPAVDERRQPEQPLPQHTTAGGQLHPLLAAKRRRRPHSTSVSPSKMAVVAVAELQ